jgi:hypothetical protein
MSGIRTFWAMSGALVALALSVTSAGAASVTVRTPTPQVHVPTSKVQVNPQPLPPKAITAATANNGPQQNFKLNYGTLKMQYQNQTTGGGGGTGKVHNHAYKR